MAKVDPGASGGQSLASSESFLGEPPGLQDVAAKRVALTAILVRNHDVLDWYIQAMFRHMPPFFYNMMFKAISVIDKDSSISPQTMWALIPAFLSSLTDEQFNVFLQHMQAFAEALNNEYASYIVKEDSTQVYYEPQSDTQSLPVTGSTHDDHRAEWERQDNTGKHHTATGNDETSSRYGVGYER